MLCRMGASRLSGSAGPMDRRLFVGVVWVGTGALLTGMSTLIGGVLSHSLRREKTLLEVSLGPLEALPTSGFGRFVIPVSSRRFWKETTRQVVVYARRGAGQAAEALLGRCSHLGCAVRWSPESDSFLCPCHRGRFDRQGEVLGGPPSEPLRRLVTRFRDGEVFVELSGLV